MERRGSMDELVALFYDSLSGMMGRAEGTVAELRASLGLLETTREATHSELRKRPTTRCVLSLPSFSRFWGKVFCPWSP